jgi:hypothetical protein
MNKFRDILTYQAGLNEKRRLRLYLRVALLITAVLIIILAVALYQQALVRKVIAAAKPIVVEPISKPIYATAIQTSTPTPVVKACSTNPSEWNLVEPAPGNQYDRIDPACVYAGLGRTVAWSLAIQMGYSREAANDMIGFSFDASKNNPAMVVLSDATILTYSNWSVVPVGLDSAPTNPEFTEWVVTPNGEPAVTDSILGCFRTDSVVGIGIKDWGDGYPVICVVAEDTQTGYHVNFLDGHLYAGGTNKANRELSLFGYVSDGKWVWLGNEADVDVDQSGISQDALQKGYQAYSEAFQAPTWNAQWLQDTFGISPKPIPDGWLEANNTSEMQAILNLLNSH